MAPSSSSATQHQQGVKRKKPPTFQHLPAQRAKKLKRSWVEVQKIKSKWKAQKRKEGLAPSRAQLEHEVDGEENNDEESHDDAEKGSNPESSESAEESEGGEESEESSGDEISEASSADETPRKNKEIATKAKRQNHSHHEKTDEQPSLRELQKMAYSPSSLHTHKSHPLHRHKGAASSRDRTQGAPAGGRGGGRGDKRGRGNQRGRGRGQPDMGLRMKAMLEKIKQDFT